MKKNTEVYEFLNDIEQLVGVRLRLVTPNENNKLEDYIQEAPVILASYLYNRFHKMDLPGELQKGTVCHVKYLLGIENIYIPINETCFKSETLSNLAEHEKMLYRYEHSLVITKSVSEGDYGKCMEDLKSALAYQITHQYSNDDRINETITAARIGSTFYYAAINGKVSPFDAENIYTHHIREILNSDSVDTIRKINRSMLRAFCDAVKDNKQITYSTVVQRAANYLSLLGGEELDTNEVSRIFKYPIGILERKFHKETGLTLKQYHRKVRLHRAAVLLKETDLPIQQIATQTGFLDQNYFSRLFKSEYNCTPSTYRYTNATYK